MLLWEPTLWATCWCIAYRSRLLRSIGRYATYAFASPLRDALGRAQGALLQWAVSHRRALIFSATAGRARA